MQDYQQNRKTAGAFGQTSFGAPTAQSTNLFGAPTTTQQPTSGSIFGGGTTGTFGTTTTTQPATGAFGAFGQQQPTTGTSAGTNIFGGGGSAFGQQQQQQPSAFGAFGQPQQQPQQAATGTGTGIFGGTSAFGQPKPGAGFGSPFGQPSRCLLIIVFLTSDLLHTRRKYVRRYGCC